MSELNIIALKILEKGKGILAADESTGTMTKRLDGVNVPSTPENRLLFRETLFNSSSMTECIGGVILYDETIKQKSSEKNMIPELISKMGSYPGIKVDTGAKVLSGSPDEKITEGLDGLRERLKEYYQLGAKFTKWRGVYNISKNFPSKLSMHANANALARYSALVQECNMVPIVEPEVLMDGDHSADECYQKTSEVIKKCFEELIIHRVDLKGIILKPNMILPGSGSEKKITNEGLVVSKMTIMGHEQVVFCQDSETGLKAIIAVHDTTLGPALGGTRMWSYNNEQDALQDVLRLSRGMSLKAAISGLDLGGGKAAVSYTHLTLPTKA